VRSGDTVILRCAVEQAPPVSRVIWTEHITFVGGATISDNEYLLNHPNRQRYAIIHNNTEFHLQISNVQAADGGRYACTDSASAAPAVFRGELELIVLDGFTNCTGTAPTNGVVIELTNHTIECIVGYSGAFPPTMYWSGPPPFIQGGSTTVSQVWAGIAFTALRTMDDGVFELKVNFTTIGPVGEYGARNVPIYTELVTAEPLTVFWGPQNTYAEPIKPFYFVGDTLTCHTDAKPEPYFMWQNLRNLDVFPDSPVFTITDDLVGTNQSMRCQVQNLIHGFVYSDNVFVATNVPMVTPAPTTPPTTPTTPPPPEGPCKDFTGFWLSENPAADLLLEVVELSDIGEVRGLLRNGTDTVWVEVIGTVRKQDWAYLGLSAIWPLDGGVTGMSGECHSCYGVEEILFDGMVRSARESPDCGVGSIPNLYQPFRFRRAGSLTSFLEKEPLSVFKPTNLSRHMGVMLK